MENLINMPLSKIVMMNAGTAPVLEKYNLDFCCKGKQSLKEAMAERKAELPVVTGELEEVMSSQKIESDFESMPLATLVDHIIHTHHRYIRDNAPVILTHLEKVLFKHGDRHPEMAKIVERFREVRREMDQHMMKEEVILFPRIKALEANGKAGVQIASAIGVMEAEHESAGSSMAMIKKLTNSYTAPKEACTTFRLSFEELKIFEMDLHQHVHLENNILFPRAMKIASSNS